MNKLSIRRAIGTGWEKFWAQPGKLFGLSLAVLLLFVLASGDAVVTAAAYILLGGYLMLLLRYYRGQDFVFDDLFTLDHRWIYFLFVSLIKSALVALGLLCFIVPGVYFAIKWMFAEWLVIDQGMRPIEAMRASSELTKGYFWKLFFYALTAVLVIVAGSLLFLIGAVAAIAIVNLATIRMYEDAKWFKAQENNSEENHE